MSIILNSDASVQELNQLLQNGMQIIAVDERSDLVDKKYVD